MTLTPRLATLLCLGLACMVKGQYSAVEIVIDPATYNDEFFTFKSRPDIQAPRWNSTVYDESALSPGYWFVTPYETVTQTHNKHHWVAPAIYDSTNGELVWNGGREMRYFDTFSLQVVDFNNQKMLSYMQPEESHGVVMNDRYKAVRHVRVGTIGISENMHDFQIVDDSTKALYMTASHKRLSREQSQFFQYDGECMVAFAGIQERSLETDQTTFLWSSEGHIAMNETYAHPVPEGYPQYNNADDCDTEFGVDYIHANSVEKLPDGDYLLSSRHMSAIYKISRTDGSIVWRLGGKLSDFTFAPDTHFSAQHDARCLSQNETHMTISLMDNAVGVWEDVGYYSNPNSRGLILSLDLVAMTATTTASYDHPGGPGSYAFERGNMQILPNGNVFVTWTNSAYHSEYLSDGTLIAEAKFLTKLKTYRSFKFEWAGKRYSKPDVYSEVIDVDDDLWTVVSVSWNGDTLAKAWSIYQVNADGKNEIWLNSTKKTGFETTIMYKGYVPYVTVDASDENGTALPDSLSATVQTIFVPDAEFSGIFHSHAASGITLSAPPSSQARIAAPPITNGGPMDRVEDVLQLEDAFFLFFCGGAVGAVALLAVRKLRLPKMLTRRRRKSTYSAMREDIEGRSWSEKAGLLYQTDDDCCKSR